jgi:hypothetical protein
VLGAHCDPRLIQIHGPLTENHGKILKNTYVSELDLDKISDNIDLEMAVNLGQIQSLDEPTRGFLNLNC